MGNLNRFWHTVESLPSLAAVQAEWQEMLGPDFDFVRPFLRAGRERAESYPRFDGGLPYEIIPHSDDDFVGVCRESGATITLTKEQLVVYKLDQRLLVERIAEALGIDRTAANEDWDGASLPIGHFISGADTRYVCILAFPLEPTDIQVVSARLIAEQQAPFILLTPTRRWARRATETTLKFHDSVFVPLVEAIAGDRQGRFQVARSLEAFLTRTTRVPSEPRSRSNEKTRQNVFQKDGDTWVLTFAEQTIRVGQVLGLVYIAELLTLKHREIDAAALKALASGNNEIQPAGGLPVIDHQAFAEYRAALAGLAEDLEEAKEFNDLGRQEKIQAEMYALSEQRDAAKGLGGRIRTVKDESAKVRTSIKNAITRAIEEKIRPKHPDLARHLDTFIRTGGTLCYAPDPDVDWEL